MKKAVLYVRVSSKDQEDGYSIGSQCKLLHEYASKNGYTVQEFIEVESAKKAGRTQFNAMIQVLEKDRSIKHILVEKTDRLLRNPSDYSLINDLIEGSGIFVHFVKEGRIVNKNSSPADKFVFDISAAVAKNAVDNLKEETKKGMLEKAEQGIYPSCALYGYMNCEKSGKQDIDINPKEAPFVEQIFELAAAGYSIAKITKTMAAEGMICRNGQPPYHSLIAKILKNRFYTGEFKWKDKLYQNASHKALVSKECFELVQKTMAKPNKQKSRKGIFAYTNLIACGICGFAITAEIKKERYIYYHCTGYGGTCNKAHVREEVIEAQIVALLQQMHVPDEIRHNVCAAVKESMQKEINYHTSNVGRIEKQLRTLQNRKNQSYAAMLDKKVTEEFWAERNTAWDIEKEQLTASLLEHQKVKVDCTKQIDLMLELPKRAAHIFKRGSVDQKRKILGLLFSKCVLHYKKIDVELKAPFNLIIKSLSSDVTAA